MVVELIVGVLAFLVGVAFIPLLAWIVGSLLGPLSEALANVLFTVACLGIGPTQMHQGEDDSYELRPADTEAGEPRKWTKWAMTRFCYSYECSEDAWGHLAADPDLREREALDKVDAPFDVAKSAIERGGFESYVKNGADGIRVRLGAALNRLKGTGHLDIHTEALQEGLGEYGGDTNSFGTKWQAVGFGVFTFLGLGMGWILFI